MTVSVTVSVAGPVHSLEVEDHHHASVSQTIRIKFFSVCQVTLISPQQVDNNSRSHLYFCTEIRIVQIQQSYKPAH